MGGGDAEVRTSWLFSVINNSASASGTGAGWMAGVDAGEGAGRSERALVIARRASCIVSSSAVCQ